MIIELTLTTESGQKYKHTIAYKGHIDRLKVEEAITNGGIKLLNLTECK